MYTHRIQSHRIHALVLAAVVVLLAVAEDAAAAKYVAPWGSDLNPGTALLPLATVQTAINAAFDGESVYLADGTYSGPGNRDIDFNGKAVRVASSSGQPQSCIIDCSDDGVTLHCGFIFSGFYNAPAVLEGLTITGARTSGDAAGALMVADIAAGVDAGTAPVLIRVRVEGNIGNGFYVGTARRMITATDCSFSGNSGSGGVSQADHSIGGNRFIRCRFVDNGVSGYRSGSYAMFPWRNTYVDCEFSGNVADGYLCTSSTWQYENFDGCTFAENGGHGAIVRYAVTFAGCTFIDNVGLGLQFEIVASDPGGVTIGNSAFERNDAGGIGCFSAATLSGNVSLTDSKILDNGGAGFSGLVTSTAGTISGCIISGNRGSGIELRPILPLSHPGPVTGTFVVTRTTIDGNMGAGLSFRFENGHDPATDFMSVTVSHTIIGRNIASASIGGMASGALSVECTDVWGNLAGNWVAALAPFAGVDGNLSADPIYCGSAVPDDPWSISSASLCSGVADPACGPIGARGVGCGASGTPDVQPAQLRLHAAQPNPFNPSTTLRFELPTAGFVRLAVYDLAGRLVRTLVSGRMEAATHSVTWDGRDESGRPVSAGAYAARLDAGGQVQSQMMGLVK